MSNGISQDSRKDIFTIPNLLSMLRIILVPVFVYLYCFQKAYAACMVVLAVSCLSDALDGWIARRFNMITDLGKAIDPIADKLTQGSLAICLADRFPLIWVLLILLIIKEVATALPRLIIIHKTNQVLPAAWHGKITTILLDSVMFLHVFWMNIPGGLSNFLVIACMVMMFVSMILYGIENINTLRQHKRAH